MFGVDTIFKMYDIKRFDFGWNVYGVDIWKYAFMIYLFQSIGTVVIQCFFSIFKD